MYARIYEEMNLRKYI